MGGISLAETLGTAVLPCFDFRDMRSYSSLFFWDMDYIPKSSRYISPYSLTTMELFHAEKSQQPKLIKLIPSFLRYTHFCQPLCWLQRLSDPARSWCQCAQLAEKYPGKGKRGKKKSKQLPAEFARWKSSAQNQINTRGKTREGAAERQDQSSPCSYISFIYTKLKPQFPPFSIYKLSFSHVTVEIIFSNLK